MNRLKNRAATVLRSAGVIPMFILGMVIYTIMLPRAWWRHRRDFSWSRAYGFVSRP